MPPPSLVELQVEDVGVALLGHRRDLRQVRAHLVGERVEGLEVGGEREGPVVEPAEVLLHQHRGLPEGVQGGVELILVGDREGVARSRVEGTSLKNLQGGP